MLKNMYKDIKTFEQRCKESQIMRDKFIDRVPVIIEKRSDKAPTIDKKKYMTPVSLTLGQLVFVIRKRLKIKPEDALFVFIGNRMVTQTQTIGDCYDKMKDEDGFLYVCYDIENTFG